MKNHTSLLEYYKEIAADFDIVSQEITNFKSFSNAFQSKFGVRPNEIKQQFLSNKS